MRNDPASRALAGGGTFRSFRVLTLGRTKTLTSTVQILHFANRSSSPPQALTGCAVTIAKGYRPHRKFFQGIFTMTRQAQLMMRTRRATFEISLHSFSQKEKTRSSLILRGENEGRSQAPITRLPLELQQLIRIRCEVKLNLVFERMSKNNISLNLKLQQNSKICSLRMNYHDQVPAVCVLPIFKYRCIFSAVSVKNTLPHRLSLERTTHECVNAFIICSQA